ncbi:MAG: lysozyme inhibitor LprI family protein [Pseudomonadota bacterium]
MRLSIRTALAALLLSLPAFAQDIPLERQEELSQVFADDAFSHCLVETEPQSGCIGQFRSACAKQAKTEGEWFFCIEAELNAWDTLLNEVYKLSMEELKKQAVEYDRPTGDHPQAMEGNLREMQRTWIPYRDALCGFAGSLTAGGTSITEAKLLCLSDETARQTLHLGKMMGYF